ncbi:MAG TPA: peptide ABC transporter substrate-binding protein, partial [Planctomycetota bacterium]|nr:peptide ABC transporter substrate-binding protein [Planctomycetota bacterium]
MTRVILAITVASTLFIGCHGEAEDPGTLVVNNNTEPQTLDPGLEKGQPEYNVTINLFEGLTTYDPKDLTVRPGMAERWEVSADGRVYTFHLRQAQWSNGDPVTARDFEWSWKRVIDPELASEYAYQIYTYLRNAKSYYDGASADLTLRDWSKTAPDKKLEAAGELPAQAQSRHLEAIRKALALEKDPKLTEVLTKAAAEAAQRKDIRIDEVGVAAPDDRTLRVTLENPTPYFLDLAAFFTYFPVHRATVEKHGKEWTKPANLVGNGPFRMKEWKVKQHILLEKNPSYWDAARVELRRVKLLPIENASTAFNLYEKGRIHWLTDVPREYIEELAKRPDFHSGPMLTTYFYGFNVTQGPTRDKKVRQALSRAIDKDKIVKFITRAGEKVADSLVPPGLAGYAPAPMPKFDRRRTEAPGRGGLSGREGLPQDRNPLQHPGHPQDDRLGNPGNVAAGAQDRRGAPERRVEDLPGHAEPAGVPGRPAGL